MTEAKPRVRVPAGTGRTIDTFQNVIAKLGQGTQNLAAYGSYGYRPITRNRQLLDWMYRGSWLVGAAVDAPADDMMKAGVKIKSDISPEDNERLLTTMRRLSVWNSLSDVVRWSRLYGGCIGVIMIEGQELSTPLRPETVGANSFRGVVPLDRWLVTPSLEDLVQHPGPSLGLPRMYLVTAGALLANQRVHHSRVVRLDGVPLPYWERQAEMGWGMSVLERIYDRLLAFDSTTTGVAQLVYKAHLRVLQIEDLRTAIAASGKAIEAIMKNLEMIRALQTNEGLTVIDAKDKFEAHTNSFAGLSDVMLQFAQQLSGALSIPMVRLFGQTPTGLNTNGESDLRTYYDNINQYQEANLREPITRILRIAYKSELRSDPPREFDFEFEPLWQLTDQQKAEVAERTTNTIGKAYELAIIDRPTAMKELKKSSEVTGIYSTIEDSDIEEAALEPPPMSELDGLGSPPGAEAALPGPGGGEGEAADQAAAASGAAGQPPASRELSPGVGELALNLDPETVVRLRRG